MPSSPQLKRCDNGELSALALRIDKAKRLGEAEMKRMVRIYQAEIAAQASELKLVAMRYTASERKTELDEARGAFSEAQRQAGKARQDAQDQVPASSAFLRPFYGLLGFWDWAFGFWAQGVQ